MSEINASLASALDRAEHAAKALLKAKDYNHASAAWEEFLIYWHRAVNKCDKAWVQNKGRAGRYADQVFADPMLSYMRVARGHDEHGLESITKRKPQIRSIGGEGAVFIERLEIRNGEVQGVPLVHAMSPGARLVFGADLEGVALVPLKERGEEIQPPTEHAGKPLTSNSPGEMARLALEHLKLGIAAAYQ